MNTTACKFLAAAMLLAGAGSALADVRYVDVNSTNATPPYTNWSTAATNIQDAVDAAAAGDEVVVTNGVYASGWGLDPTFGEGARVVVDKALSLRSVNGPQVTTIDGGGWTRCAYLTDGASLIGFTLTNGLVYVEIIGFRIMPAHGGGAYGGTLNNCTLTGNSVFADVTAAPGGGTFDQVHALGGGAYACTLNNCTLSGNSAGANNGGDNLEIGDVQGGGAYACTLNNCTVISNSASLYGMIGWWGSHALGGGAASCTLNNCTLSGNSATAYDLLSNGNYAAGGGADGGTLNNCIFFRNYRYENGPSICEDCQSPGRMIHGNWHGNPLFVDTNGWADLRLQSNSPCINTGNNAYAPSNLDLDGNPRIAGGTVDIGAYEFQSPVSMISYAWLQQYGLLPANPATDTADPDGDAVDNYHEWLAGTDPTNPFSSPAQLTIIPSGTNVIVAWSTNAVGFILQSTTNLVSPSDWSTNSPRPVVIGGQNVIINPVAGPQRFYRLRQ